ncbi:MAG: ABC transporter ATP-binding protein [Clostridia bacterium]|nr:ABC transporter ATP-binding protein [Clostridia bacterium]
MHEYFPLIAVGGFIGLMSVAFAVAYAFVKSKKQAFGFDRTMTDRELLKRLLSYAKPYYKRFILVLVLMIFSIAHEIISPYILGYAEELLKGSFTPARLYVIVGGFAAILLVSMACTYAQSLILQKTGQKIVSRIREDTFRHIEGLSHGQLTEIPVGKLVTRVSNDAESVSRMFTNVIVNLVKNLFVIFGVLAAMLVLNYELTLMILCFVPFIIFFTVLFRKFSRMAFRREKECTTDINTFLSENLSGMKITQNFNRTDYKNDQFTVKNERHGRAMLNTIFVFAVFRPVVYVLYMSSVMLLFYLGAKGYLDGAEFLGKAITGGVIVSFYMYISRFFDPIQNLAEQFNVMQSALASAEKIFTVLDIPPMVTDDEDAIELNEVRGDIEFRDVWFAYKGEEWVLKGVSFRINARETVAFVGATGSGKTTILSLLCRNYDIQKGTILLDGVDIKKIKISSLRKHFGQMLQDVFLFAGTVRSNITLRDEIPDEEIMEACRYVNADKLIAKLPGGLDEEVRERSNNFSAGERQLLSFARMIIHRPEVLILDEATANIDAETELLIQNSLEKMMKTGTMLMVAHRLSTIQHADKIIVLSHGEIIEQGNHFELIEKRGRYYDLYTLQYKKQELSGAQSA